MQKFILLTTLSSGHDAPAQDYDERASDIKRSVAEICPDLEWLNHYVVLGPFDFLDIVEAPDATAALKAAAEMRNVARADVRAYSVESWRDFKQALPQS